MVLLKGDKPVRQLMLLARAISFNRLIPGWAPLKATQMVNPDYSRDQ